MTTYSTCWKVTRRDATVEGYTDHDKDLVVDTVTYRSAVGFAPTAVDRSTGMEANNEQLIGIIDSNHLDAGDLRNGTYTGARVEVFVVDWANPAAGSVRTLLAGHLGEVTIKGEQYQAELISLENELSKPAVRSVSLRCDADLGDTRCGYTGTITASGSVVSVTTARRVFIDTSRTEADGYFDGGKVTWTSGVNNGRTMDVKKYTAATDTIELYEPMPDDISASDGYNITRGCDKTHATCRDTFDNAENFRGFPFIPGYSDVMSGQS